jgi:hypothetical protein
MEKRRIYLRTVVAYNQSSYSQLEGGPSAAGCGRLAVGSEIDGNRR